MLQKIQIGNGRKAIGGDFWWSGAVAFSNFQITIEFQNGYPLVLEARNVEFFSCKRSCVCVLKGGYELRLYVLTERLCKNRSFAQFCKTSFFAVSNREKEWNKFFRFSFLQFYQIGAVIYRSLSEHIK